MGLFPFSCAYAYAYVTRLTHIFLMLMFMLVLMLQYVKVAEPARSKRFFLSAVQDALYLNTFSREADT